MLRENTAITLQLTGPCFLVRQATHSYWRKSGAAWVLNGTGSPCSLCCGAWLGAAAYLGATLVLGEQKVALGSDVRQTLL